MNSFAADTAVERVQQGSYRGVLVSGWDIGGNANGGYMLAIAARAMATETGRPDPVTITAHYLSPGRAGPVTVDVHVVKQGKRFGVASAAMHAGGKPLLQVLGTFGNLGQSDAGVERIESAPPDLPPPGECVGHRVENGAPALFGNVDLRLHPEDAGFASGKPSGQLRVRGWFRFARWRAHRYPRPAARGGFLSADLLQREPAGGLDADDRADHAPARAARAGLAARELQLALRQRGVRRGGRRGLGLDRPPGGAIAPARAAAIELNHNGGKRR